MRVVVFIGDKKSPHYGGYESLVQGRDRVISSRGQYKKMNGLYTTKPFRVSSHLLFCQRLLGVRRLLEKAMICRKAGWGTVNPRAELTLSMMRPAGREQVKRIDTSQFDTVINARHY